MDIVININCDNQAFERNEDNELVRILTKLAADIKENGYYRMSDTRLRDVNGNTVGRFKVVEDDD